MDPVDKLYNNYSVLVDPANNPSEHEAEYLDILRSVKGEKQEKILASQFIPKFFRNFPHLAENALDSQLDLLEDEDVAVRMHAIKNLPNLCKDSREYVTKVADILAQMLQTDDSSELSTVHSSLTTLIEQDATAALQGLLGQVTGSEEEIIRKRCIQYLCGKLGMVRSDILTKEIQEYLLQECKKVFRYISGEEFLVLISFLSGLKVSKTIPGHQALVEAAAEQAELDEPFDSESPESIVCLLQCVKQAIPHFSQFVSSERFVNYICLQVLPKVDAIKQMENGNEKLLDILKYLAEISSHANNLKEIESCISDVFHMLLEYIPLPVIDDKSGEVPLSEPNLEFTHIECLLFTFTRLLQWNPEFLISKDNTERFEDLKRRLQFLARSVQSCLKTLKESLQTKKGDGKSEDDNKIKLVAIQTMKNINFLIRDLFRQPPSFKTQITLSWKPTQGVKRELEELPDDGKHAKKDMKFSRELYAPPGGKYSKNVSTLSNFRGSRFAPRARGRKF